MLMPKATGSSPFSRSDEETAVQPEFSTTKFVRRNLHIFVDLCCRVRTHSLEEKRMARACLTAKGFINCGSVNYSRH